MTSAKLDDRDVTDFHDTEKRIGLDKMVMILPVVDTNRITIITSSIT
jgi:hypothetical protein